VQTRNNWQLPAEGKNHKTQLSIDNCRPKPEQVDYAIEQIQDLITMPTLKPWYCSAAYKLGVTKLLQLASIARADGKDKPKFFSYLINRELKKHRAAEMRQPSTVLTP